MIENNRGQTIITFFFILVAFIVVWAGFLAKWLNIVGEQAIQSGATGLEAWAYANLNLFVLIGLVLLIIMYNKFG